MGGLAHPRQRTPPGAGHVRGREAPSAALALAGDAVLHRGPAHRVRRQLRARGPQQLRRTPGAHWQPGAGARVRASHRDPRPQDTGLAAHTHARRTPGHGGAARRRTRVQPLARDAPHPGPGQGHRGRRGAAVRAAVRHRRPRRPTQAVGHRQPGPALPPPPGQQRLRAGHGRWHLQLPPRQGRHRAAGQRGTGGHRHRRCHAGAGRARSDPGAPA